MTKWLNVLCGLFLLTVLPFPAAAQSATDTKAAPKAADIGRTKFSSRTELVLVPVLVTKGSQHVSQLKKDDFTLKQDGSPQKLAVFEEIKASSEKVLKRPTLPEGVYSNIQSDPSAKRLLIIAFDGGNTPLADQPFVRQQLIKYLSQGVPADTMVSLVVLGRGRMRVVHNFTTDPQLLIAALTKVQGGETLPAAGGLDESQALAEEVDVLEDFVSQPLGQFVSGASGAFRGMTRRLGILDTLSALQQIAQAYAGVPGRKALVWVSEGFPFNVDNSQLKSARGVATSDLSDVIDEYEKTWRVLNEANVAVYPVDAKGLVNTAYIPPSVKLSGNNPQTIQRQLNAYTTRQQMQNNDRINTMEAFASMTGGRAYYNTNALSESFRKAADDSSAYYLLGYYLDKSTKPGWHKLKVELAHHDGHVRARSGFFADSSTQDQASERKAEITMAMESPLDFTGLPLYLKWQDTKPSEQPGKRKVTCQITLPPGAVAVDEADNNHMLIESAVLARAERRRNEGNLSQVIEAHLQPNTLADLRKNGFRYTYALDLLPGNYSVRFVMRDDMSGHLGSVTVPVQVK